MLWQMFCPRGRLWHLKFTLAVNFGKKLNGGTPIPAFTPQHSSFLHLKMSANQNMMTELAAVKASSLRLETELAQMKQMMQEMSIQSSAPKKAPRKKVKAEEAEGAEPKEKRPPSLWILFSVRVQKVLRPAEEAMPKAERTTVGTMNQFAGTLWSQTKASGKEWTDEEISAAFAEFTPPVVSKQTMEGKSKRSGSTGSGEEAEPVADEKKTRKPQSEETKAAGAAKRAATNAKKAAEAKAKAEPVAEAEAEAEPVAEAEAPKPAKNKAKITAKPKKVVDILLDPFEHEGTEYLKNSRGDVTDCHGEWVGHWTGSSIDTEAPEPADFHQLTTRD